MKVVMLTYLYLELHILLPGSPGKSISSVSQLASWTEDRSREIIGAERYFEAGEDAKAV